MTIEIRDLPPTPVQFIIPRDGMDRPMVVPETGGKPEPYTRTTTFIDCIEDKSALATWGKRMVLAGAAKLPTLIEEAVEVLRDHERGVTMERGGKTLTPLQTFKHRMDLLAERALTASGAHEKREKGTDLHGLSELVDQGIALPDSASVTDRLDMAAYALATMSFGFTHIEQFVVVPELKVGGTPDRICTYEGPGPDGKPISGDFIFDLKTGTVEYGGLKMASQLAAYSRAKFYDPTVFDAPPYAPQVKKGEPGWDAYKAWQAWKDTEYDAELAATAYSPIPPVNQEWGIIVNLPSGSGEAELYWANLRIGWEAATLAKTIRAMRSLHSKALVSFANHAA